MATFADDTVILATGKTSLECSNYLQPALNELVFWASKWKIKINTTKSTHVNFSLKNNDVVPLKLENFEIPHSSSAKYLGLTLDSKLTWRAHVLKKKKELNLKYNNLNWLMGRKSPLAIENKLIIYQQILKPIWSYGSQLWGCAKPSIIGHIQSFQNRILRNIVNAPWYIRNTDLQRDLGIDSVKNTISKIANTHHGKLLEHVNIEARELINNNHQSRRLRRTKPQDLLISNNN